MLIMCIVTRVSNLQSVVEDFLLYYNNSGCKLSYCHLSTKYINTFTLKKDILNFLESSLENVLRNFNNFILVLVKACLPDGLLITNQNILIIKFI